MKKKSKPEGERSGFSVKVKLWIENEGRELVIGAGRVAMLEAIEREGSLNGAARALNMSYRALWQRLRETEKRLGQKLLIRATGGKDGGGSELTPLAREIIAGFRELDELVTKEAQRRYRKFRRQCLRSPENK